MTRRQCHPNKGFTTRWKISQWLCNKNLSTTESTLFSVCCILEWCPSSTSHSFNFCAVENNGDFSSDEWDSPAHSKVASPTIGLLAQPQAQVSEPTDAKEDDQPSSLPTTHSKQPTRHRRQSKNTRSLRSSHLAVLSRFNAADRSSGSENNSPDKRGTRKSRRFNGLSNKYVPSNCEIIQ